MSDDLQQEIQELRSLIQENNNRPNPVTAAIDTSGKYIRWIQATVGLVILIVGLGINWGITKTEIEVTQTKVSHIEEVVTSRIEKIEQDVHELQLKQAGDDQILKNIQITLDEIKVDIRKLAGK